METLPTPVFPGQRPARGRPSVNIWQYVSQPSSECACTSTHVSIWACMPVSLSENHSVEEQVHPNTGMAAPLWLCALAVSHEGTHETDTERSSPTASAGHARSGWVCPRALTGQKETEMGPASQQPDSALTLRAQSSTGEKLEFRKTNRKKPCAFSLPN